MTIQSVPTHHMHTYFMTDHEIMQVLGARISHYRLADNITQNDLARHAGVSRDRVRAIEAGENVSMETLVRILRSLRLLDEFANSIHEWNPERHNDIRDAMKPSRQRARKGVKE